MFMLNRCFAQEGHLKTCEVLLSFGATASQQVKWGDVWPQSLARSVGQVLAMYMIEGRQFIE